MNERIFVARYLNQYAPLEKIALVPIKPLKGWRAYDGRLTKGQTARTSWGRVIKASAGRG